MLEGYSHIELTEDEVVEAMIAAKRKKEAVLKELQLKQREAHNRKLYSGDRWSRKQTESFMEYRSELIFDGKFNRDASNEMIFKLLCCYFSEDDDFCSLADHLGVINPSLQKGILLAGSIGVGKTWMMKLFSRNQRQVYAVKAARSIAETFTKQSKEDRDKGADPLKMFYIPEKLPLNDKDMFFHTHLGLCLDDIGTEEIGSHFGNRKNVIGDLIERRYELGHGGIMLHMTTNLTMGQVKEFYGDRIGSRLREIMNIVELKGEDRRK